MIGLSAPIPILRIFSEEAAHAFHLDFLGFQVGRQMQIADPFGNRIRFCELSA